MKGTADMKTVFAKCCFCFTAAFVLLACGCKSRNEQGCGPKCYQQDRKVTDKQYDFQKTDAGFGFLKTFYGDNPGDVVDLTRFAARSFLSKQCSRISPVENGETTVPLPAPDSKLCPSLPPRGPLPSGTPFPGIGLIGRLELKVTSPDKTEKDYLWATAFKVGQQTKNGTTYDLIATTCHVLQPVIELDSTGRWILKPPPGETLWVDLGERTEYPGSLRGSQYQVTELIAHGKQEGFDVAFLKVEHFSDYSLRFPPQVKSSSTSTLAPAAPLTVIGYVDFSTL
jgi:hypothetical protein